MNITEIEDAASKALALKDLDQEQLLRTFIRLAYYTGSTDVQKYNIKTEERQEF